MWAWQNKAKLVRFHPPLTDEQPIWGSIIRCLSVALETRAPRPIFSAHSISRGIFTKPLSTGFNWDGVAFNQARLWRYVMMRRWEALEAQKATRWIQTANGWIRPNFRSRRRNGEDTEATSHSFDPGFGDRNCLHRRILVDWIKIFKL